MRTCTAAADFARSAAPGLRTPDVTPSNKHAGVEGVEDGRRCGCAGGGGEGVGGSGGIEEREKERENATDRDNAQLGAKKRRRRKRRRRADGRASEGGGR